jgi:hypothetical protein
MGNMRRIRHAHHCGSHYYLWMPRRRIGWGEVVSRLFLSYSAAMYQTGEVHDPIERRIDRWKWVEAAVRVMRTIMVLWYIF